MAYDTPHIANVPRDAGRIGARVISSVALLWSANFVMRLMQLATAAILARLLTPDDYGLIALATTIVGFVDLISNLQTAGALIRIQHLTEEHLGSAFAVNLIRGSLTALVLVLLSEPLASYMHDARLAWVLYALAPSAIIGSLHNPRFLLFARNLDYRREAKRNALAAIGGSIAGVVTAIIVTSYWALVVGSLCANLISMALSYWRVPAPPRLTLTKSAAFVSYGSWLVLINVMEYVNSRVDYILIGKGLGNRVLGAYHVGQQVMTMATGDMVAPMSQALMPAFSLLSGDPDRLKTAYRRLQSSTLALVLPIGVGVSVLAPDIVLLVVGKRWELAIPVIRFLAPLGALHTMIASIEALALATNNGRLLVLRTSVFLYVRTCLMFAGFYMGGFMGVVYARLISGTFFLLYGLSLAASITSSKWFDPILSSWRSLIAAPIMWGILYLGPHFVSREAIASEATCILAAMLAVKIVLGATTYIGTHWLLWRMSGCPEGAEQKLLELMRRICGKLSMHHSHDET